MSRSTEIAKARKIDTEVARLWDEFHVVNDQINALAASIKQEAKSANYSFNRNAVAQERSAKRIALTEARINDLRPKADALRTVAVDYDNAHYTGWTRFFLVQHIHNTTRCSSFRMTTRIGWLPKVSGLTEAEAVKEYSATLCTICFPSAPTELTTKPVDETICTGTRDYTGPSRSGYYSGNWGTCTEGHTHVTLTSAGNLRKHKK